MRINHRLKRLGIVANLAMGVAIATTASLARSVQLRDGTTHFVQVPQLGEVYAVYDDIRVPNVAYYFTVTVPADAGEPLQRLTIAQQGFDQIRYKLPRTWAYANQQRQHRLSLSDVSVDRQGTLSVQFEPVVPPGTTVTVGVRSRHNPDTGGVYLFGVTAFPQGEKAYGQFLGYGRITFFDSNDSNF